MTIEEGEVEGVKVEEVGEVVMVEEAGEAEEVVVIIIHMDHK